jgi:Flp pilus assembly protein TadG
MGLSSFWADCKGNIAVSFGLLMIPISLAAGAAIDASNANYTHAMLQAAADTAALAAGTQLNMDDAELEAMVKAYVAANGVGRIANSLDSVTGKKNLVNGTYQVIIRGKMPTSLMSLAGITEMDIDVAATVAIGSRALDLALVLDVTGSMNEGMATGTRLSNLQSSATRLLDILEREKSSYSVLNVGVVPFAEYVNVGINSEVNPINVNEENKKDWAGCVGSRAEPADTDANAVGSYDAVFSVRCPATPILPLMSNFKKARDAIQELTADGNTYIPGGVLWGWNILTEAAPFSQGMSPDVMKEKQGYKYMVVMTDGKNTIGPVYPLHDTSAVSKANELTEKACASAKADNIQIFTISFMVTDPDIQKVLTNCASLPEMAFDADNAEQLDTAFTTIGKRLAQIRIQN